MFAIYKEIEKLFGTVIARQDLHRLIAINLGVLVYFSFGYAIFFFWTSFNVARLYLDIAGFILILPILLSLFGKAKFWLGRKRLAGNVLLDLGLPSNEYSNVGIVLGGFYIFKAASLIVSAFSNFPKDYETAIQTFIYIIMWGSFGSLWILLSLSHLEIRERGICYQFTVIKWEVIEAYRWLGFKNNMLCIRHQAKVPFFPLLKFKIPLVYKDRVEQMLSLYLPVR